ncbi:MAG: TcpQ domain-containing protein [Alphaproteobacteria bacterium]
MVSPAPAEAPVVISPTPAPLSVAPAPVVITAPAPSVATQAPEVITPVIIEGGPVAPPTVSPRTETMILEPYVPPAPLVKAPAPEPWVAPVAAQTPPQPLTEIVEIEPKVVKGFAKQVPLAVALRQMLPAGYAFSIDPDVDLGILVSFQGGRPWRETLRDALDAAGLLMREQGQMVTISRQEGTPISVSAKAAAPAPNPSENILVPPMPVATSIAPPPSVASVAQTWKADAGESLHKTLDLWTSRAGIEINWIAEYDYPIQASFSYTGNFEDAVRHILTGFENAHPQPVAELHNNPGLGQKVLIVQARGNSYSD